METKSRQKFGEFLIATNKLSQNELDSSLEKQSTVNEKIGQLLVEDGYLTQDQLLSSLGDYLGYEVVDFQNENIDDNVINLLPVNILRKYKMIPISFSKNKANTLRVAMDDPLDVYAKEDISIITNYQVEPVIANTRSIMFAIDKYYGQEETKKVLDEFAKEKNFYNRLSKKKDTSEVDNSPIVQLVNRIIDGAVRQRASDIHIEPLEKNIRIRYRIDGVLLEIAQFDLVVLSAIITRIKIIAEMDIAEKRKPQDGRIIHFVDGVEFDIRVSTLPSVYGEKIVLRLSEKNSLSREKCQLGLKPYELKQFDEILANPYGILLVTGPTGSGKTTTLYTALNELNTSKVNIITVEDPVEAKLSGITQVQVNKKIDLSFANALRSILRQDPDIVMIGEIRDIETARIAIQASLTGHFVASTIHTNSAANTITRLLDMGIEPYLIADSLSGIIAQRLVRKLCPYCKIKRKANIKELEFMGIEDEDIEVFDACGCGKCENTGYHGRIGVYEIMKITPRLRRMISTKESIEDIKEEALTQGMRTLKMSGIEYVKSGITSCMEVMRISMD